MFRRTNIMSSPNHLPAIIDTDSLQQTKELLKEPNDQISTDESSSESDSNLQQTNLCTRIFHRCRHVIVHLKDFIVLAFYFQIAWISDLIGLFTEKRKSVQGQVVVITGAAQGIGFELAQMFAIDENAIVCLLDRNQALNEKSTEFIREQGGDVYAYTCDVTDCNQMKEVAKKIQNKFGQVHILIANAGVLQVGKMCEQKEEHIRLQINVNVLGVFWTIRAFLPQMKELNCGHVVGMGSVGAIYGESYASTYSATKFAVRGIMESLENELHDDKLDGIKCTTLFPFFVKTGLLHGVCNPSSRFFTVRSARSSAKLLMNSILKDRINGFTPQWTGTFITLSKAIFSSRRVKFLIRDYIEIKYNPIHDSIDNET